MSKANIAIGTLVFFSTASCVHSENMSTCGDKWAVAQVASTPVAVDNVPGFAVVDVHWPSFLFYENSNKSGRVMVIDAVGHIVRKPGTKIRIDISKDKNGDILLLWYGIARNKLVELGIDRFDGNRFVPVCREKAQL